MNHEWRVARRWFVTAAVLIALIAAVPFVGPDGMDGGFAIQFLAFFGVVVCLVAGGVYAGRARVLDRLLSGDGVLADTRRVCIRPTRMSISVKTARRAGACSAQGRRSSGNARWPVRTPSHPSRADRTECPRV